MKTINRFLLTFAASASIFLSATSTSGAETPQIAQLGWLSGIWRGEGMGGVLEETFEPAKDGEIVSTLTLTVAGKVTRYELRSIRQQDGKIVLQEVAFGPGLKPAAPVGDRTLISADSGQIVFEGLTLKRTGENSSTTTLTLHSPDGSARSLVINYTRVLTFAKL